MKTSHFYLLSLMAFLFTNCSMYHYSHFVVQSHEPGNEYKQFIFSKDSVDVKYDFFGISGPVHITINNQKNKPIYVDWKKSALIVDGKKYDYWKDHATVDIYSSSSTIESNKDYVSTGSIEKDERIDFIPPNSFVDYSKSYLVNYVGGLPESNLSRKSIKTGMGNKSLYWYRFNENDSPLKFRSYITVSFDQNFEEEIFFESDFWVTDVIKTDRINFQSVDVESDEITYEMRKNDEMNFYSNNAAFYALGIAATGVMTFVLFSIHKSKSATF
jgi:hypothetical protein